MSPIQWRFLVLLFLCLVTIPTSSARAHPHIFVDARVTLLFDEQGLAGFRQEWTFDEMFGEFILEDYDANKNKRFEDKEVLKIKAEAFDNLKESDYFHIVQLNGKPFAVKYATDFSVQFKNERVVYTFTVPCHMKVAAKSTLDISLSLSDKTIYTDLVFTKDSPKSDGKSSLFNTQHKLDDGVQPSGQVLAQTLHIKVTRK